MASLLNLDWSVLTWIQQALRCSFLDTVMPYITALGDNGIIWIIISVILLFSKKYRRCGILMLCGLVAGILVGNVCLKNLIARSRPCWLDSGAKLLVANPTDFSFPSGHTLASVIAATVLTLSNRRFAWFAIPLAALIAFSRLYLYLHFPSDILGAALIGILIGCVAYFAGNRIITFIAEKHHAARE